MKTLKESLLDIDGTIKQSTEVATEEGIRIFIKKLFRNGFSNNPKEIDDSEFKVEFGLGGYTVRFAKTFRRTIFIDEGYDIPSNLWEIKADNGALYCVCNGNRADCSVLGIITTRSSSFELIAMQEEVTWVNFNVKKMRFVPDSVQFECGQGFSHTTEHKFENCNFGGLKCISYDDADLRDAHEPVPGYTSSTAVVVTLNNCMISKNTSYELVKAGIEGLSCHLKFTKDRCIVPEYGDEVKLYNRYFPTDGVNGIKAKYVHGVNINNLQIVDSSAKVVEVHTADTVNIKKSPLSFVPETFLLGGPLHETENHVTSTAHLYKITSLDINCEKFVDEFYQPDLKMFSSKSCKYINTINDTRLSQIITRIIEAQPSSYKDLDDIINMKKLPNLKYLSFSHRGHIEMLEKMDGNPFWVIMSAPDALKIRREYQEVLS